MSVSFVQGPSSDEASATSDCVADMAVDREGKVANAAAAQGELRMTAPEACELHISRITRQAMSAALVSHMHESCIAAMHID